MITPEDRAELIRVASLIRADAVNDATTRVEFTPLGIGTMYGELLGMIHGLTGIVIRLAQVAE